MGIFVEAHEDRALADSVRAALSRVSPDAAAIEVEASDGVVRLRGVVLERDRESLLECVHGLRGVVSVNDELEGYYRAEDMPEPEEDEISATSPFEPASVSGNRFARLITGAVAVATVLAALAARRGATQPLPPEPPPLPTPTPTPVPQPEPQPDRFPMPFVDLPHETPVPQIVV